VTRRAWTARAVADALGVALEVAQRALEDATNAGECVRMSRGATSYYVGASLSDALAGLDVLPADAADVQAVARTLNAGRPSRARLARARKRVARAKSATKEETK